MQLVEHRVEIEAKGEIPGKPTPGTAATDLYQQGELFQTRPDEQDISFDLMNQQIPEPTRARLCGLLDMIRASDGAFEVVLESGERAHGLWVPEDRETLSSLWNQRVLLEGIAHFKPSGGFLRLEADAIRDATASDSLFAFLPTAIEQKIARPYAPAPRHRQLRARESFLGKWPGDETEEQLLAALRELRS